MISLLGQPQKAQVCTESGEDLPASSPKYLVLPADMSHLGNKYLTDQICVIDFGESFPILSPPKELGIPENYLPPELLLEDEGTISPACDLWALGCTLFEIRQQIPLFYMIFGRDELLAEIVRFFGKLPKTSWAQWEARGDFFDSQGRWIREGDAGEEWTFEGVLSKPVEIVHLDRNDGKNTKRVLDTSEVEQRLMADLLYKLFCYQPGERAGAHEVLEHEWFKM